MKNPVQLPRGWLLLMAALLAGALSALALSGALAAPRAGFLRMATNLSNSPNRYSYYADIAVSPDGDRVVVVWPEAYQDGGSAQKGSVYLRWASESTGSGWSAPVTVHAGGSNECARWAAVAITGTGPYTAHVAYIVQSPCNNPTQQFIRHRTCVLGAGCSDPQTVVNRSLGTNDTGLGSVDLALDDEGRPHFAYVDYQYVTGEGDVGTVYYRSPDGIVQQVSGANDDALTPAIAWNGGKVHIVWATEPRQNQWEYYIYYWQPGSTNALIKQGLSYAPHEPAIAVFSNTVMVVWEMNNADSDNNCSSDQTQCTRYTLAYIRSVDNGSTWPLSGGTPQWYELHRDGETFGTNWPYTSTGQVIEYTRFLRPSVGFRADGKPVVVWHVNDGTTDSPDYNIYYTEALTVPESAADPIEWSEIRRFGQNPPGNSASPVVAPLLPTDALHVVYLQGTGSDWETYYDGNEYDRYSRVYLPIVMRSFQW